MSGQLHFELPLSLGNKNPIILHGRVEYDTEYLKVKKVLQVIVPRVLWLELQKVCMQYQRKLYCITDGICCKSVTLSKKKLKIAVKNQVQKIKEGYIKITDFSLHKPSQMCLILSQMVASKCKFNCRLPFFPVLCQILEIHSSPVNITLNILGLLTQQ